MVKSVRADVKNTPDADRKRIKADFGEPEKNAESGDFEGISTKEKEGAAERNEFREIIRRNTPEYKPLFIAAEKFLERTGGGLTVN